LGGGNWEGKRGEKMSGQNWTLEARCKALASSRQRARGKNIQDREARRITTLFFHLRERRGKTKLSLFSMRASKKTPIFSSEKKGSDLRTKKILGARSCSGSVR